MADRDVSSWAIIVSAYAEKGHVNEVVRLLLHMLDSGIISSSSIFCTLLRSFSHCSELDLGKQIHSQLIRIGFTGDVSINTYISNMDALSLFAKMISQGVKLDEFVFSIVLKACAALEDLSTGRQIHSYIVKLGLESEVSVGIPLVDFYVKCASFEAARQAFESISEPNDFSWCTMITGYCQSGKFDKALEAFNTIRSKGVLLNSFIYTNTFQSCSAVSDLIYGTQVHVDAIKKGANRMPL
ncbi:hypothetical protein TSUD_228910 [Trifolium subterraneum]|uniref:Pentatricopeptide repeat-containing protein n=1 Tax=Trifolium subterraneum TaxID=3900 RepID=A0A2Z6LR62_TRISU|nr:hypothetical protein TSUD_228910 [Trifolium subterraneum]